MATNIQKPTLRGFAKFTGDKLSSAVRVTDMTQVVHQFRAVWEGTTGWFSPGEPIPPVESEPEPRTRQMQVGFNLLYAPRGTESTSFEQLRFFAAHYDIARIAIQVLKEELSGLEWDIVAKKQGEGDLNDAISSCKRFFERPDREHDWPTWLSLALEDRLVCDAMTLYPRPNRKGGLYALEVIDGALIKPLVDARGAIPDDPAPAYQQILWGVPRGMWSRKQLLYLPQNVRTNTIYGFSEIEGILYVVNMALRKRLLDLAHWCYDDQTEILTREGWRRFADLRGDEEVATRSPEGQFEWQRPSIYNAQPYRGEMVRFKNRQVDLLVTPNHRMLVRYQYDDGRRGPWYIERADTFLAQPQIACRREMPATSTWTGTAPSEIALQAPAPRKTGRASGDVTIPIEAWLRFLGLYLAEGSVTGRQHPRAYGQREYVYPLVSISQKPDGPRRQEVEAILRATGLRWTISPKRMNMHCYNRALARELLRYGHGAGAKHIPADVKDLSPDLLRCLLEGMLLGDGTLTADGQRRYTSISPQLADDVQEIWQKCGVDAAVTRQDPPALRYPNAHGHNPIYIVTTTRACAHEVPEPTAVPYDGNIYCVAVPNGIVYVRRNGRAIWCGNTDGNIPAALMGVPGDWSPDQIQQYQQFFDAWLAGDPARRSRIVFTPSAGRSGQMALHEFAPFTGDAVFDKWLMGVTLAALRVTPADIGFTDDVNRATGESQENVQYRRGVRPLQRFVKSVMDRVLREYLFCSDLEWTWQEAESEGKQAIAQVDKTYYDMGVYQMDEIRDRLGLQPFGVPPFIMTPQGPVFIKDLIEQAKHPQPPPGGQGGLPPQLPGGPGGQPALPPGQGENPDQGSPEGAGQPAPAGQQPDEADPWADPNASAWKAMGDDEPDNVVPFPAASVAPPDTTDEARHDAYRAARDDLRRWRTVALKCVRQGQPVRTFASEHVPLHLHKSLRDQLGELGGVAGPDRPAAVLVTFQRAFDVLEKAEIEGPAMPPFPEAAPTPAGTGSDRPLTLDEFARSLGWGGWSAAWLGLTSGLSKAAATAPAPTSPPTAAAIAPSVLPQPPAGVQHSPGPSKTVTFNGKQGHWVTIHGHPVFIEDAAGHATPATTAGQPSVTHDPTAPGFQAAFGQSLAGTFQRQHLGKTNIHHVWSSTLGAPGTGPHVVVTYVGKSGFRLELKDEHGNIVQTARVNRAQYPNLSVGQAQAMAQQMLASHHAQAVQQYAQHHVATVQAHQAATAAYQQAQAAQQAAPTPAPSGVPATPATASGLPAVQAYYQSLTFGQRRGNDQLIASPSGASVLIHYTGNGWQLLDPNTRAKLHTVVGRGTPYAQMVAALYLHNIQHGTGHALPAGPGASVPTSGHTGALALQHAGLTTGGASAPATTAPAPPAPAPASTTSGLPPGSTPLTPGVTVTQSPATVQTLTTQQIRQAAGIVSITNGSPGLAGSGWTPNSTFASGHSGVWSLDDGTVTVRTSYPAVGTSFRPTSLVFFVTDKQGKVLATYQHLDPVGIMPFEAQGVMYSLAAWQNTQQPAQAPAPQSPAPSTPAPAPAGPPKTRSVTTAQLTALLNGTPPQLSQKSLVAGWTENSDLQAARSSTQWELTDPSGVSVRTIWNRSSVGQWPLLLRFEVVDAQGNVLTTHLHRDRIGISRSEAVAVMYALAYHHQQVPPKPARVTKPRAPKPTTPPATHPANAHLAPGTYVPPAPKLTPARSPMAAMGFSLGQTSAGGLQPEQLDSQVVGGKSQDFAALARSGTWQNVQTPYASGHIPGTSTPPGAILSELTHGPLGFKVVATSITPPFGRAAQPGQSFYSIDVHDAQGQKLAHYDTQADRDPAYINQRVAQVANWVGDNTTRLQALSVHLAAARSGPGPTGPIIHQFAPYYAAGATGAKPAAGSPIDFDDVNAVKAYLATHFPKLVGASQHSPHGGNDPIDHTAEVMRHLDTTGLSQVDAQLLRLAAAFHDVGKAADHPQQPGKTMVLEHEHPRQSEAVIPHLLNAEIVENGQQRKLTPPEVADVYHLVKYHDTMGDAQASVGKITHQVAAPQAHDDRMADLMGRLATADAQGIPGFAGSHVPGSVAQAVSGVKAEMARQQAAGTFKSAYDGSVGGQPSASVPSIVAKSKSGQQLQWGEYVQKTDKLNVGQQVPYQSTVVPPKEVYGEVKENPDLNFARAFGMAYDGPTGDVVRVYHATHTSNVDPIFQTGVRASSAVNGGAHAYGWGIYTVVNGAQNTPSSFGSANVAMEVHAGRVVHHDDITKAGGLLSQFEQTSEGRRAKQVTSNDNAAMTSLAALHFGYTGIVEHYTGAPMLVVLDPARVRLITTTSRSTHQGHTVTVNGQRTKLPDLTAPEINTPSGHDLHVKTASRRTGFLGRGGGQHPVLFGGPARTN